MSDSTFFRAPLWRWSMILLTSVSLVSCSSVETPSPTPAAATTAPATRVAAGPVAPTMPEPTPEVMPMPEPEPEEPPHVSIARSPEEAIATMELQPGYSLEVVLAEPNVSEPVMITFDGNGTMYVAEMNTYMQDADATGEMEPVSRVSRHEDTDGDGVYDKHTTFAEGLLLPRTLLTLERKVIIGETNTLDLYVYEDTDGDGVADTKELWFEGGRRGGNLEHQPNGMLWGLDNGLYATYNDYRLRVIDGEVKKESIPGNAGQWGVTQDNWGKVWFVNAGNETGPAHFQQHILYGQFESPEEHIGQYKYVWAIDDIPDTQGGAGQLKPGTNKLLSFTATTGQDYYRGDRLPEDVRGDLFFAEPVGRLIRRTEVTVDDGIVKLANPYEAEQGEFIRTTDPLFRPVNMITAPDGTLYLVDMYRGIIQEGNWTRKGSYLREQIDAYNLDKEIGLGRIYRIRHQDFEPGPQPRMLEETPAQWVAHLSHPNGWWRDTAQKLLILRGDKSVVPALRELAGGQATANPLARSHALWTLEGLGELTPDLVQSALADNNPNLRRMGLRLAEGWLLPEGGGNTRPTEPEDEAAADRRRRIVGESPTQSVVIRPPNAISEAAAAALRTAMKEALNDADPEVVIQAMVSLNRIAEDDAARELIQVAAHDSTSAGVYNISEQLKLQDESEDPYLMAQLGASGLKGFRSGKVIYDSLCFSCHGPDGQGVRVTEDRTLAPPLAGSKRVLASEGAIIDIVLNGMEGLVDGFDYGAPMVPMNSYSDEELANVLTYIRNSFGNRGAVVAPATVADHRAKSAGRSSFWTMAELETRHPILSVGRERFVKRDQWKLDTSEELREGSEIGHAIDGNLETTFVTQRNAPYPGQWISIKLPARSTITAMQMDTTGNEDSYAQGYEVRISNDGRTWGEPVAVGVGEENARLQFPQPVETQWLKITLSHKEGWRRWSIANLELFGEEQ